MASFFRHVKRAIKRVRPKNGNDTHPVRASSFPFVSGDTFRAFAGVVFSEDLQPLTRQVSQEIGFVGLDKAVSEDFPRELIQRLEDDTPLQSLIIHNGDQVVDFEHLERILSIVPNVYCVNTQSPPTGAVAIPIGLENAWRNKNGRLKDFLDVGEKSSTRNRRVLSSFSVGTNTAVRQPLAVQLGRTRHGFQGMSWKTGEFRDQMRASQFVIAPPGNGPDTHRTWEAIYCGAVPVVLEGSLDRTLREGLPILAVEKYDDFFSLSDSELDSLFESLNRKPREKAYAAHWITAIHGNCRDSQ